MRATAIFVLLLGCNGVRQSIGDGGMASHDLSMTGGGGSGVTGRPSTPGAAAREARRSPDGETHA
jgi:hypothetical protein